MEYSLDQILIFLKHYQAQGLTLANVIEILEYDREYLHNQPEPVQGSQGMLREAPIRV